MIAHSGLAVVVDQMMLSIRIIKETVEEIEDFLVQLRDLEEEDDEDTMHEIGRIIDDKKEGIEVNFSDVFRSMKDAVDIIEKVAPGTIFGFNEFLECCRYDASHRHMRSASDVEEYIDRTEADLIIINNCAKEWYDGIVHFELDVVIDFESAINRLVS